MLRKTESSMYTSPIVLVRGKGSPLKAGNVHVQREVVGGAHTQVCTPH